MVESGNTLAHGQPTVDLSADGTILENLVPVDDEIEFKIRKRLGNLQILGELGRGGMAVVYEARDENLNRSVALKCMSLMYTNDDQVVERFKREAQMAANLTHPHIVRVYSHGVLDKIHYFTMEYLPGGSLADKIRQNIGLDEALEVTKQIAAALDYAHSKGFVHRDIKPANIMFDEHGAAKVLDFGIGKMIAAEQLTATRSFMGTPHYMSPEQAQGKGEVDGRSDLYSLGVVLYQMLVGQLPFDSPEPLSIIYMHVNEAPRSPIKLQANIPRKVAKIILKLLAKNPAHRYQSGQELVAALEADEVTDAVTQLFRRMDPMRRPTLFGRFATFFKDKPLAEPGQAPPPLPNARRKRPWLTVLPIMGGLLFLCLLAWLVFFSAEGKQEVPIQAVPPKPADIGASIPEEIPSALPFANLAAPMDSSQKEPEPITPVAVAPKKTAPPKQKPKPPSALDLAMRDFAFVTVGPGSFRRSGRGFKKYTVTLSEFDISTTEVPQKFWQAVMETNPSCNQGADLPVENVTFDEVAAFIARLNERNENHYRLPTEAEWEFAARAGRKGRVGRGHLEQEAWFLNTARGTHPCASKAANELGLYDMAGNVWEWCADFYARDYYKVAADQDPPGPETGPGHVIRGGAWNSKVAEVQPSYRDYKAAPEKGCLLGFRLIRER